MNLEVKYWYLSNHQLFDQLNDEQYKMLCVISGFKRAKKNEVIYFSLEPEKRVYFLKHGLIKIEKVDESGNEVTLGIMKKGDIFGEIVSQSHENKDTEYAKVISDEVIVCSFTMEDFENLMEKYPEISLKYAKKVGERLKELETRYNDLVFKDVRTRLIQFLKKHIIENGKVESGVYTSKNYLTHHDIANLIGASRQTVTSILNELESKNLISYSRTKLSIPNISKLK